MTLATVDERAASVAPPRRAGPVRRALRGALRTWRGRIGMCLALAVFAVALIGPLIPGTSDTKFIDAPYSPPGGAAGLLGTDELGRSVFNRVLHGGTTLLLVALAATVLAVTLGSVVGVTSAYFRGARETVLMRGVDVVLALPQLVFVLMLVSVAGSGSWLLVLAVGLSQAPQVARVVHAASQDVCERDYVQAVAVWGVPPRRVIRRHIMPSLVTPLMVEVGLRLSFSIIVVAGINFLGFGTRPPNPSWGVMINENRLGLVSNPWAVAAPAILLALLAIGTNTFTDAIARASLGEDRGEEAMLAPVLSLAADQ